MRVTLLVNEAVGELRDAVPAHDTLGRPAVPAHLARDSAAGPVPPPGATGCAAGQSESQQHCRRAGQYAAGMPAKVVICQHSVLSSDYLRTKGWSHRVTPLAYRLISPGFARAVAVSAGIAREFRTIAHIPQHKISGDPQPRDRAGFRALRADQPVDASLAGRTGRPLFVTAGRLVAIKDHETLLRALAIYRRQHNGRLLILGAGPLRDSLGGLADELGSA